MFLNFKGPDEVGSTRCFENKSTFELSDWYPNIHLNCIIMFACLAFFPSLVLRKCVGFCNFGGVAIV